MSAISRHPIGAVFCLFDRHDPDRGAVHWGGTQYLATCRICGKPIRRQSHKVWKAVTEQA